MWRILIAAAAPILVAQSAWQSDEVRSTNRIYQLPAPVTLTVQSNLVEVGVVVRDARGHAVGGLQKGDFRLYDEGKERAITAFSVETAAVHRGTEAVARSADEARVSSEKPAAQRSVVLFFDDFSIATGDLGRTKLAASRFVKEALDPGDRVAIVTSSSTPFLDFTSDTAKVLDVIARVSAHVRVSENGILPCPRITPYQAYLITIHDLTAQQAAIDEQYVCDNGPPVPARISPTEMNQLRPMVEAQAESTWQQARLSARDTLAAISAALDRLSKVPGTRMLVLASSGFLTGTLEAEQDRIVDRALRANIVINALDAKGLYAEAGRPNGAVGGGDLPISTFIFEHTSVGSRLMEVGAGMAHLAESTGGLFLHDNNDLEAGLRSLVPETTYHLGFAPAAVVDNGKYHALKIRLNHAGSNHVLARRGYFMPAPAKPSAPLRSIDRVAAAADTVAELPVRVVAEAGGTGLAVTLVVDVKQLKFTAQADRREQKLSFVAVLYGENGDFISGKEGELKLSLKDATYAHFAAAGISTRVVIPAWSGVYRLRTVVEDEAGKMMATVQRVELK